MSLLAPVLLWVPVAWAAVPAVEADAAELGVPHIVSTLGGRDSPHPPSDLTVGDSRVYLRAAGESGRSLFASDASATTEVPLPSAVAAREDLEWLFGLGDHAILHLVSVADPGIWRSDGTPDGTRRLADVNADARSLARVEDILFFASFSLSSPGSTSLWRTDGTEEGTFELADLGGSSIGAPAVLDRQVYFRTLRDGLLWRSDGTTDGTFVVDGHPAGFPLAAGEDALWFWNDGLWRGDGSAGGAIRITDTPRPDLEIVPVGRNAYFLARDPGSPGTTGLWASDGTTLGTERVSLLAYPTDPRLWAGAGGVFAREWEGSGGVVLWHSRGTASTSRPIAEVRSATGSGVRLTTPLERGERTYFFVVETDSAMGTHWLWMSDGSAAGTRRVVELPLASDPRTGIPDPVQAGFVGSTLYFVGVEDGEEGLWAVELEDPPSCLLDCDGDGSGTTSDLRAAIEAALDLPGCAALGGMRVRVDLVVGQVGAQTRGCSALRATGGDSPGA